MNVTEYPCSVILDSNLFENNSAANKGGALRYINTNFTTVYYEKTSSRRILSERALQAGEVDSNTYKGNKAAYGDNIASYPASFRYTFKQNGKTIFSSNLNDDMFAPG